MRTPKHRKITADSLTPHPEGDRERRRRLLGISAWIIQWVPVEVADHPLEEASPHSRRRVTSILSPRISHDRVYEIAKAIYLAERADPAGMLAFVRMQRSSPRSPSATPLTPMYAKLEANMGSRKGKDVRRLPFTGRFRIGHDPCLYARKVKNLRERENGTLDWDEIPMPRPPPNDPAT
jgi:hypothetical protein